MKLMADYGANPAPDTNRIHQVAHGYLFAPQDNLKVDQFSTATSLKVYKLTRRHLSTNLRVLVDPAQIPAL